MRWMPDDDGPWFRIINVLTFSVPMKILVKRMQLWRNTRQGRNYVWNSPRAIYVTDSFADTFHIMECFVGHNDNRTGYTYF